MCGCMHTRVRTTPAMLSQVKGLGSGDMVRVATVTCVYVERAQNYICVYCYVYINPGEVIYASFRRLMLFPPKQRFCAGPAARK